ncbi:MAG: hypothetical protein IT190_10910 [Microbacteriaceae bacterium]|jgi:hypothetical protein|nr:hypothetical protein [Microbacteriaceae bacterium]
MVISSIWPLLVFLGGIVVWAIRAEARSRSNEVVAAEAKAIAQKAIDDLTAFKERVAQEYVTATTLLAVREEIGGAINRLAERIDRILEARKT